MISPHSSQSFLLQGLQLRDSSKLGLDSTDHGLTEGGDAWDAAQLARHSHRLSGLVDVAQLGVAVDDLDAGLDQVGADVARVLHLRQGLPLPLLHHEAFLETSLVVIKVDVKITEGRQLLVVLRTGRATNWR